ncbi:MAG TPA: hypothetical protein VFH78_15680 [Candidatus Thermoplasmatota archaeon]|nr:hypothetical protein [Candidatus Thermoplasmatota archaeon]
MVDIPQGAKKIVRFYTRRGDGAFVDPDGFNAADQSTWPVTTIRAPNGEALDWKPSDGEDPQATGLYHYGTGVWGQAVQVPSGATVQDEYRVAIEAPIGGVPVTGSAYFDVVLAGSATGITPGLVDRDYVRRVLPFDKATSFGYSADENLAMLIDDAILAASEVVRQHTGRTFIQETKTRALHVLDDSYALSLDLSPVTAIPTVKEDGKVLAPGLDYSFTSSGLLLRHDARRQPLNWKRGVGVVEVTYTEGANAVPEDVKWATARVVESLLTHFLARRNAPYIQVGTLELEAPSVAMLEPEVRATLDRYRRRSYGAA